jgi:uncharacterized protein YodC (DUF2158 family)
MSNEIVVGDLVKLKSGSPQLTVREVFNLPGGKERYASVVWMSG